MPNPCHGKATRVPLPNGRRILLHAQQMQRSSSGAPHLEAPEGAERCRHPCHVAAVLWESGCQFCDTGARRTCWGKNVRPTCTAGNAAHKISFSLQRPACLQADSRSAAAAAAAAATACSTCCDQRLGHAPNERQHQKAQQREQWRALAHSVLSGRQEVRQPSICKASGCSVLRGYSVCTSGRSPNACTQAASTPQCQMARPTRRRR